MPREYTPIATIDLSLDRTAVIEVYPLSRIEEGGFTPWAPTLVVTTVAGELRFSYSATSRKFSVSGKVLRYRGMPSGCTLQAHRDERAYHGFDIEGLNDDSRTPSWNPSGYDHRSDDRAVTRNMSRSHDEHLEAVTARVSAAGHLRKLIEVTRAWEARKRLVEVEAEIARLASERAALVHMTAITIETRPDLANLIALCDLMGEPLTVEGLADLDARVAADEARIAADRAAEAARLESIRADKRNRVQLGCYLRHR